MPNLYVLHPVGCVGHVAHSSASRVRNVDALFSYLGETSTNVIKSMLGHVVPNLCFCIRWDLQVTFCIVVRPRRKMLMHHFSCSGGSGAVP
jgi:hypothetical protein